MFINLCKRIFGYMKNKHNFYITNTVRDDEIGLGYLVLIKSYRSLKRYFVEELIGKDLCKYE